MHTLYYAPGAASLLVHWMLIELDIPHVLHRLDLAGGEHKQAAYLAINPAGVVPTLVIDGVAHAESAAIAMYLAESHPTHALAPSQGTHARAAYIRWMLHLANVVQPALRVWWYPHEAAGAEHADAGREQARMRIEDAWSRIDAHLSEAGPWMLGDSLSVVDFYLTMLMRWSRNMPKPATAWPNLAAIARQLRARPAWKRVCAAEGLTEWA